jgi:hypothetical protein
VSYGFVYCLANAAMPGLYKIGHTKGSPHARAEELSRSTGVPIEFYVVGYIEIDDPHWWEQRFHEHLARFRANDRREFFRCRASDIAPLFLRNEYAVAIHDADFSPCAYQEEGIDVNKLPSPYRANGSLISLRAVEV